MKSSKSIICSALCLAFNHGASAAVVYLADSIATNQTGAVNQPFSDTLLGTGFDGPNSIISGTTTVGSASTYTLAVGIDDGRFNPENGFTNTNTTSPSVTYNFATSRDLGGLLLWNYNEIYEEVYYNDRGLTRADVTITHSLGTTTLQDVAFALSTSTTSAQAISFGGVYNGVSSIHFDELRSNDVNFVGWTRVAFTAVPEPSSVTLVGGLGVLGLLRRRRAQP